MLSCIKVMQRRAFIGAITAGTTIPIAGCLGDGDDDGGTFDGDEDDHGAFAGDEDDADPDDTGTANGGDTTDGPAGGQNSPEGVVEGVYQAQAGADPPLTEAEALAVVDPYVHDQSPILDAMGAVDEEEDFTIDMIETTTVQENLAFDQLDHEFSYLNLSESLLQSVAGENAVVEWTIEYGDGDVDEGRHLTAPVGGQWVIVV